MAIREEDQFTRDELRQLFDLFKVAIEKAGRPLNGLEDVLEQCPTPEANRLIEKAYAEGFGDTTCIYIERDGEPAMNNIYNAEEIADILKRKGQNAG